MKIIFIKDEENIKSNSILNLQGSYEINLTNIEGGKCLLCFEDLEKNKDVKVIEYKKNEDAKKAYNSIITAIVDGKDFIFI